MSFTMRSPVEWSVGGSYVGLDVHRESVVASVLDEGGQLVPQSKFGPTDQEFIDSLGQLPGPRKVARRAEPA
jgi:hypothetical protein